MAIPNPDPNPNPIPNEARGASTDAYERHGLTYLELGAMDVVGCASTALLPHCLTTLLSLPYCLTASTL